MRSGSKRSTKRTDLFFLDSLIDEVGSPESSLLGNLLGFNCMSKLLREGNVCDGDIIKDEVEATCALGQIFTDQTGNLFFHQMKISLRRVK